MADGLGLRVHLIGRTATTNEKQGGGASFKKYGELIIIFLGFLIAFR